MLKKYIFLLKYFIYKPKALGFFKKLIYSQKNDFRKLEEQSFTKFIDLLIYSYENSVFYKRKYDDAELDVNSIKTIKDLYKIPILTKEEIRQNLNDILTVPRTNKNLGKGATGGSTGKPMTYYQDKRLPVEAFAWRYLEWWGLKPWNNGAYIWRMPKKTGFKKYLNQLAWWPVKKIRLDATFLDENNFQKFVKKINQLKPELIQGYVGAVHEFAIYLKNNGINIHTPKAVWVTSAPVSKIQRELIENVFGAPLYNEYGSSEIPWIASQCEAKKYLHVNVESRLIEIINEDVNGEGDIVITDLDNFLFPLIRYELGDKTKFIKEQCCCGKKLPLIDEIKGRVGDIIIIPNVGKIDGSFLSTIFDLYPNAVLSFQLVQHKNYNLSLNIVPNYNYQNWEIEVKEVLQGLQNLVNNSIEIEIKYCNEIKSDRGKTRYIIRENNEN